MDVHHSWSGQVAMTPYDSDSPMWNNDGGFKGEAAEFSPLAVNGGEDPANVSYLALRQHSPMVAGGMSSAGCSPSSPNVYSPTSPYVAPSCLAAVRHRHSAPPLRYITLLRPGSRTNLADLPARSDFRSNRRCSFVECPECRRGAGANDVEVQCNLQMSCRLLRPEIN